MVKQMGALDWVAFILLVVGALNLGIMGLTNINIIEFIFGAIPFLPRLIYTLIGLAGIWKLYKVLSR